jgi:hypothetical protein
MADRQLATITINDSAIAFWVAPASSRCGLRIHTHRLEAGATHQESFFTTFSFYPVGMALAVFAIRFAFISQCRP